MGRLGDGGRIRQAARRTRANGSAQRLEVELASKLLIER